MEKYTHGNHWDSITTTEKLVEEILPQLLSDSVVEDKVKLTTPEEDEINPVSICALKYKKKVLTALSILLVKKEGNLFLTCYPFCEHTERIWLQVEDVIKIPKLPEAIIKTCDQENREIAYFDTKYYNTIYHLDGGGYIGVALTGFAYKAEIVENTEIKLEGQDAIKHQEMIKEEIEFDDEGNVKPIVFSTKELVAFLPDDNYPDDYEFQSPVFAIDELEFFGEELYKLKILILRDKDVYINLFVKKSHFNGKKLEIGMPIRGFLWLQGYRIY